MANELLDAALHYARDLGWPVFPCNASKAPLTTNGVSDATTNLDQIRAWWEKHPRANIGLDVGGAGMMALDFDPGSVRLDPAIAPETALRSRTPRGGDHWFYEIGRGEVVSPSSSKLAPHVDVRSFHSYVLLPPSRTADGAYSWESEGNPAFRTDEAIRLANSHREKSAGRDEWLIAPDLDENVAAAVKWLREEAKPAVEGQGGDNCAYATAAMMKSLGISAPRAFELMWDHWNPRCVPPWSADDAEHLEAKIEHGFRYNTSPPGNMTAAYRVAKSALLFKPVAVDLPSGREKIAGRFRFVDRAGMAHIKPATWLLKDFLPIASYAMLIGAPGTFKTFVALDIALTVATGFPVEGLWDAVATGAVLYAAGEGRANIAHRVGAWERVHWGGKPVNDFILVDPVPNVAEDWQPFTDGALDLSPAGYKLVVIDTVGRAMAGLNENSQEHASKLTQKVEQLQAELGCAVLCLHHTGYDNKERARGSGVFTADADTVVRLDREDRGYDLSLTMLKQKDAPEWDRPRRLAMREVVLGGEPAAKSLVAVPATPVAAAPEKPAPRPPKGKDDAADLMVLQLLDRVVVSVLATNPLKPWTQGELAAAVAMRPEVELASATLRTRTLTALREDKRMKSNALFDAATNRWRHRAG